MEKNQIYDNKRSFKSQKQTYNLPRIEYYQQSLIKLIKNVLKNYKEEASIEFLLASKNIIDGLTKLSEGARLLQENIYTEERCKNC